MAQEFINSLNETCKFKKWTMEDFNSEEVSCYSHGLCYECDLKVKYRSKLQAKMLCEKCMMTWSNKRVRLYLDETYLKRSLKSVDWLCDDCASEFITLNEIKKDLNELKGLVKKLMESRI